MRVLIVGCGYIGLPLGAELAKQGHEVFGLRRTRSADAQLEAVGITPLQGDITSLASVQPLPAAYDWVVNTVSSSHGGLEPYRQVYLQGMRNLLAWLAATPPKRFVYTSSTSVYGQTDGSWVEEDSITTPATETSRVLLESEDVLLEAARKTRATDLVTQAVVLRVAGIYGPGRGYWFQQFLRGEATMSGQGERILNMIHREDVVGAIIAALTHARPSAIYNAVDDEPVAQIDLFRWLSQALGRAMPPFAPVGDEPTRKRGLTNKRVSNRKLKTELGYKFKYPTFREGFRAEYEND